MAAPLPARAAVAELHGRRQVAPAAGTFGDSGQGARTPGAPNSRAGQSPAAQLIGTARANSLFSENVLQNLDVQRLILTQDAAPLAGRQCESPCREIVTNI